MIIAHQHITDGKCFRPLVKIHVVPPVARRPNSKLWRTQERGIRCPATDVKRTHLFRSKSNGGRASRANTESPSLT